MNDLRKYITIINEASSANADTKGLEPELKEIAHDIHRVIRDIEGKSK